MKNTTAPKIQPNIYIKMKGKDAMAELRAIEAEHLKKESNLTLSISEGRKEEMRIFAAKLQISLADMVQVAFLEYRMKFKDGLKSA